MANELLYVPGIGTRYYYASNNNVTLTEIGSGTLTSALESNYPTMTFGGNKCLYFAFGSGISSTNLTIEYWMSMPSWNNTGTIHQWGHFSSGYSLWRPIPASGSNNVNFQLDFSYPDPEDTVVALADQTTPVHVAEVYDRTDSNYQLKLYVNGTKVKEHYLNRIWDNAFVLGGSISSASATAPTDSYVGKISQVLISTTAKYTANFTPARYTVDTSSMLKAGNPVEGFTAPEISYLDVGGIPYKIVVAS